MGLITFLRQTTASAPTPGSGKTGVLVDATTKQLGLKDDSGNTALLSPAPGYLTPGSVASLTANSASINTTETVVLNYQTPINSLRVGTTFRVSGYAQGSGSTTANGTVTIRVGTAGTTADTSVVASGLLALTAAAVGTWWDALITVRTIGVGGTIGGNVVAAVSGVVPVVSNNTGTVAVNTTSANYISVTVKTSATTNSMIVTACDIVVDQW